MQRGLLVVLGLLAVGVLGELTFQVDAKSEECFYHELASNEQFNMEFEVLRGGLLDIKMRVLDPNQRIVQEKLAFFNTRQGVHSICFDNRMSRWTAKVVTFHVTDGSENKNDPHADVAKLEHLGPVVDSVIKIGDELDLIHDLQRKMRVEEQSSRDVTAATNSWVHWLSLSETVLLVVMFVFQFKYVQTWFKDSLANKRMSGRV